ncbi:MAG: general secretion pathway protein L [Paraglaciecola psychrophila]|jgi:general secretion pathway protein L
MKGCFNEKESAVTTTLMIKACGIGNFEWQSIGAATSTPVVGDGERLAEALASGQRSMLLAPGKGISFRQLDFDTAERKILAQTVPYALEDELIDNVDSLHFALAPAADNTVDVAIVARDHVDHWLSCLADEPLELQQLIPELYVIPRRAECWSLLLTGDHWTVRSGPQQGLTVAATTAPLALQLLLDESQQLPEALDIFGAGDDQQAVLIKLPELLRGISHFRDEDYWAMAAQAAVGTARSAPVDVFAPINLLQGDYAPRLPWAKWWSSWRITLWLLLAAIVVGLGSSYSKVAVLEQRNIELRQQIEAVYRRAIPRGAVLDAEKQLQRKVSALQGDSGSGFIVLLDQIGAVLAASKGLTLQSLNYSGGQSEVRITLLADDFVSVEKARAALEARGLSAELSGSSTQGNKTRARLKIGG